jgi:succinylglutamate desuccinylase
MKKEDQKKTIIKIDSGKPGKTVAIFCGIHGDEKAGIMAVDSLRQNIKLKEGILYLVYGNPKAIKQNVRFTEKNLNRCFLNESKTGGSYEEKRATELMKILDKCDALLDLHAYNEPFIESIPFAICESNCFDIVKNFDLKYVLTNIDKIEKGGTDGYMFNCGKIGICVELGAIEKPKKFVDLGIKTIYQFLQYFGSVEKEFENDSVKQIKLRSNSIYKKKNKSFKFTKKFSTFDQIKKGELVCIDGDENIIADKDQIILFPREKYDIGVEAFISAINYEHEKLQ